MKHFARITMRGVGMFYFLHRKPVSGVRELLSTLPRRVLATVAARGHRDRRFWALHEVGFQARDGDIVAVIGRNGAGKSTLMKLLAGIIAPDTGEVEINGRVSSLLSLNAGQQMNLTGRENIILTGLLLGLSRQEIEALVPSIVEFSELGDFIDQPVKTYSSGMRSRLGFSTVVKVDTDILLLDEIFSVGDATFRDKAKEEMRNLMDKAKTIFIVTHNIGFARDVCNQVLWLDKGRVMGMGSTGDILPAYERFLADLKK